MGRDACPALVHLSGVTSSLREETELAGKGGHVSHEGEKACLSKSI